MQLALEGLTEAIDPCAEQHVNTNGSSISFMCNEHLNHHKWSKVGGSI
ncbi:MAG: hypothetical protein VXW87_04640 [Pseudomonadota bacterium]|nr:hypothetical protein [Pseudomonadota bacterium]